MLDGKAFIASASEDGSIVLWDVKSKSILQRVEGHKGVCFWVDVHGETMVSAGQDHTVNVYRHIREHEGTNGNVPPEKPGEESIQDNVPSQDEDIEMEDR